MAQFCEHQGRNIGQALSNRIGQSFANQAPTGFRDAITGQIVTGMSSVSMAGLVRWVSGRPGEAPAYAGTDFIIARDGRIAAVYLFFDKLP